MTAGVLVFAHNNEQIDYVGMAAWSASRIRRHLDLPVAVVTDRPTDLDFDQVILWDRTTTQTRTFGPDRSPVIWNNHSRIDAYMLSPWDTTLVLDADYVVASDRLRCLIDCDHDFLCHRWAHDITGVNDFAGLNFFGTYNMPQWWATVMMFRKSPHAKIIFECMHMIQQNWSHYRQIYHNPSKIYRNDHALSIALMIANGHVTEIDSIPWSLGSLLGDHLITQLDQDRFRVDFARPDSRSAWIEFQDQDFHAMGKSALGGMIAGTR